MDSKGQLRLLLWKDFLVRRRHPGVAVLLFGWAVSVFMILYIVRKSIDPIDVPTCQYKARALPNDGLLTYLQSFICNFDNKCEGLEHYEEVPEYKNASLWNLAAQMEPVFLNDTFLAVVKDLPKTMKLVSAVAKGLDSPRLEDIFGDGIPITTVFSDSDEIKERLENETPLNRTITDVLFDSAIRIQPVLDVVESIHVDSVVCNPDKLEKYLILKDPEDIANVSEALCSINPKTVPSLMQKLMKNVNFQGLLSMLEDIFDHFTSYDLYADVGNVLKVFFNLTSIEDVLPKSLKLSEWVPVILPKFKNINKSHVDMETLNETLKIIDPYLNDSEEWRTLRTTIYEVVDFVEWIQNVSTRTKRETGKNLTRLVETIKDDIMGFDNVSTLSDFTNKTFQLVKSSSGLYTEIKRSGHDPLLIAAELVDTAVSFLPHEIRKQINYYFYIYSNIFTIVNNVVKISDDPEGIVFNNSVGHETILKQTVLQKPQFVSELLKCFIHVDCMELLVENRRNIEQLFCDGDAIEKIFKERNEALRTVMCSTEWSEYVKQLIQDFGIDDIMDSALRFNVSYSDFMWNSSSFHSVVMNTQTFLNTVERFKNPKTHYKWRNFVNISDSEEWNSVYALAERSQNKTIFILQLAVLKTAVANHSETLPYLKLINSLMKGAVNEFKNVPFSLMSNLKRYLPGFVETLIETFSDKEKVHLMSLIDFDRYYCKSFRHDNLFVQASNNISHSFKYMICSFTQLIENRLNSPWTGDPLYEIINDLQDRSDNFSWNEFIENSQRLYLLVEEIVVLYTQPMDWSRVGAASRKFWESWSRDMDFETGVQISAQLFVKFIQLLDSNIFSLNDRKEWQQVQATVMAVNRLTEMLDEIMEIGNAYNSFELQQMIVPPRTLNLSKTILSNLDIVIKDLRKLLDEDSSVVSDLLFWINNPCNRSAAFLIPGLHNETVAVLNNLADLLCNPDKYALEWKQDPTVQSFEELYDAGKTGKSKFEHNRGYSKLRHLIGEAKRIENFRGTVFRDVANVSKITEAWNETAKELESRHKQMELETLFLRLVDKQLADVNESRPLLDVQSALKNCTFEKCKQQYLQFVKYTIRYLASAANEGVSQIRTYLSNIKGDEVNPLFLLGFTNTSGPYIVYEKLADLILVFVHSYRSSELEEKIIDWRSREKEVYCSDIFNALTIPPNNRVTKSDINIMSSYICINIFKRPKSEDNILTNAVEIMEGYYFDVPVSKLNVSYVALFSNIMGLKSDLDYFKNRNITVLELTNEQWVAKLDRTWNEIRSLNFTQNNTITRYFKYINEQGPKLKLQQIFLNTTHVLHVVGGFSKMLDYVSNSLENFTEYETDDPSIRKETEAFIDVVEFYPREVTGIFVHAAFMYPWDSPVNLWQHFDDLCHANVSKPEWMVRDENNVLRRLCKVDYKKIQKYVFSLNQTWDQYARSFVIEDLVIDIVNTITNFTEDHPNITFKMPVFQHDLWRHIIAGMLPTTEESRNTSRELASYLANAYSSEPLVLDDIDFELKMYAMTLKLLQGGDWWKTLKESLKQSKLFTMLRLIERIPDLGADSMDVLTSPSLLYNIVSTVQKGDPSLLCTHLETGSLKYSNNIWILIHDLACNQDKRMDSQVVYELSSGKVDVELLENRIYDVERALVDFFDNCKTGFDLPDWLNGSVIAENYNDYLVRNRNPFVLLQVFTTALNDVLDIGALYYANITDCKWCTWATILVQQVNNQLKFVPNYVDLVCRLPDMSFNSLRKTLSNDFHWNDIEKQLKSEKSYTTIDLNTELHLTVEALRSQIIYFFANETARTTSEKCIKSILQSPNLKKAETYVNLTVGVMDLIKSVNVSEIPFLRDLMVNATKTFKLSIPVMKPLKEILANVTDFSRRMVNIGYKNEVVDDILNASVDVNELVKINSTYDTLNDVFDDFNKFVIVMDTNDSYDVYHEVITHNATVFKNLLTGSLKLSEQQVKHWRNESVYEMKWVSSLVESLKEVIFYGGSIVNLASKVDVDSVSLSTLSLPGVLDGIVELIEKHTVVKLFRSLRRVVKDFSPLIHNATIESDVLTLLDALESMEIFKNLGLLNVKYKIADLLVNWINVDKYLVDEIGMDAKAVDALMGGSIDVFAIISSQKQLLGLQELICNPERITELLSFESSDPDDPKRVSEAICGLKPSDIKNISKILFDNVNFTQVVNNIVDSSVDNILALANLTKDEGRAVIDNVRTATTMFPSLKTTIVDVSNEFKTFPKFDMLKSKNGKRKSFLAEPDLLPKATSMLCGRPLIQKTNRFLQNIIESKDYNNKYDQEELDTLPTPFCKDLYKDIVGITGGKIIWTFIKTLTRGKIIFTPDNVFTRKIMHAANNTFEDIDKYSDILDALASGFDSLNSQDLQKSLKNVQKLLNSSIIKIAVQSMLGSSDGFSFDVSNINFTALSEQLKSTDSVKSVVHLGSNLMKCILVDRYVGVDSEEDLLVKSRQLMNTNEFIAGIVFLNVNVRGKRSTDLLEATMPKNITYKIRMDIDNVPSTHRLKKWFWAPGPEDDFLDNMRYFRGFVQMQDMIDTAIIKLKGGSELPKWSTYMQEMPYPCWKDDFYQVALYISQTYQVSFFFALMVIVGAAVRYIVWEKETGNAMLMNVMGLKPWVHQTSWFITTLIEMFVVMFCAFLVSKVGGILPKTNSFLLLIYLLDFGLATVLFCYMVSTMFTTASIGSVAAVIFYLLTFMPYITIISLENTVHFGLRVIANLFMSTSFSYGCLYILRYEIQGDGLQWSNVWKSPVPGDDTNFGINCLFVLFDGLLYGLIGYLLSRNSRHINKAFRYILTWIYTSQVNLTENTSYVNFDNLLYFDRTGKNYLDDTLANHAVNDDAIKVGVTINNLTKVYKSRKGAVVAIKDIKMELYSGQVTTLLGHNGAGKTTLIKILTGTVKPTYGEILVNSQLSGANDFHIGVCPQSSILIGSLTAKEHLSLYAQLKTSKSASFVLPEVLNMLDSMGLVLINEPVSSFSEGMKRRLCVGIAFIGQPKLVVLDEPSSGVDPVARRQIWELIVRHKAGRTVLLTTHHLDEAELLSDRVIILHKGEVLCSGSPLSLKHNYGTGYQLSVTYSSKVSSLSLDDIEMDKLIMAVQEIIPNAFVSNIRGSTLVLALPFLSTTGTANNFEKLALTLEENQEKLGFSHFAMNCTTLEEVFMDLCKRSDFDKEPIINTVQSDYCKSCENGLELNCFVDNIIKPDTEDSYASSGPLTGSWPNKMAALLKKRFIHYVQDWRVLLCALVLPTVFTALAMGFSMIRPQVGDDPPLRMDPHIYFPYNTEFLSVNGSSPFVGNIKTELLDEFRNSSVAYKRVPRDCKCVDGGQVCSGSSNVTHGKLVVIPTVKETMEWIIETQDEYVERRYGGWTLNDKLQANKTTLFVWYNNKGYHAMPSYLNSLNNALLHSLNNSDYIETYNHPLQLSKEQLSRSTVVQHVADVGVASVLLIAFNLVVACGAIYLIQERVNEEKRLQHLSGVSPTLYWTVAFIWDIVILIIALILSVVVFEIFRLSEYVARQNLEGVTVLIFLYGWSVVPFVHIVSRFFTDASMGNMVIFSGLVFSGFSELTCILLMDILGKTQFVADMRYYLHKIFLIFPQFTMGDGLIEISRNNIQSELLSRFNMDTYVSPFSWDLLGLHYTLLAVTGVVFFIINLIIENRWFSSSSEGCESSRPNDYCLETRNLRKEFSGVEGTKVAVNSVNLKVPTGQCLGLVGVNGAGKSTTFRMLTTELAPTSGSIVIHGRDIGKRPFCSGELGYCPQRDALDPKLTVHQSLKLYATLRGIWNLNEAVETSLSTFALKRYEHRKVEALSGGNKRKLCSAISVLGRSSIILMDEPTSGMDPGSRSIVGNAIQKLLNQKRSVILTSHSMEECEALCSSVAVMINGNIICQGSPQELKDKFGSCYLVSVRLTKTEQQPEFEKLMRENFPGSELQSQQFCSSQYLLPTKHMAVSAIFRGMSNICNALTVHDYSLMQSSLDQVFINLASSDKSESKLHIPSL